MKRMEKDVEGIRPAVLHHETVRILGPYLGFRHFFRHSYTFELDWMKVKPLVEEAESVLEKFRRDIEAFFAAISHEL